MTSSINIYAGPTALKKIKAEGFKQEHFNVMAGASGGPKWFTLFGLDCYLFGEFFAKRKETIHTIGSSAGAWRMACFAQKDPVAAISRLAEHYSHETYSAKPDANEISDKAELLLAKVLAENGASDIATNAFIQTHLIVAKAKGFNQSENRLIQMAGLLSAATSNAFSRKNITRHFERYVFYTKNQQFKQSFFELTDLPTQNLPITEDNIKQILIASGSIPMVLRGVKEIQGAPKGVYRDGGIIDYHLDLDFCSDKLILYPHFFPVLKPGWFDKNLKKRSASLNNYHNVVMITPSQNHVDSLPYKKISDRTDFQNLDPEARINYWQTILDKSHLMAEDLKQLVEQGIGIDNIIPIETIL